MRAGALAWVGLLAGTLMLFGATAAVAEQRTVAVVFAEYVAPVTEAEGSMYYQGVAEALGAIEGLKVLERQQLKLVLDERDLSLAFGPEDADSQYAAAAKPLDAQQVVVPAITKIENDYLLCLRLVSVVSGATQACTVHRTRLVSKFAEHASQQVKELLGAEAATSGPATEGEQVPVSLAALRTMCAQAGAERLFPALWERCEKLLEAADATSAPRLSHYYVALMNLCRRAMAPPEGMVFVPGGYVRVETTEGRRELWVEPFFVDRCEVSVVRYDRFRASATIEDPDGARKLQSITAHDAALASPELPVTGITYEAAAACARWEGKSLPTMLQWMRAACGDDGREYPCGGEDRLGGCRLKTATPASPPEPAGATGRDVGPFGTIHMTGNVREWTSTWYDREAYSRTPADRPEEPGDGTLKVVKGGSWRTAAAQAACKAADRLKPTEAFDDVGFRCVRRFFLGDAPGSRPASTMKVR